VYKRQVYAQAITAFGVLPVTMKNFTATKKLTAGELNWTTSCEINCAGYDIERSLDGNRFSKIGYVNSKSIGGNCSTTLQYSFQDNKPLMGTNYYRLKQMDIDGNYKYSNIATVKFDAATSFFIQSVFPNPAVGFSDINLLSKFSGNGTVVLFDEAGRKINQFTVYLNTGENSIHIYTGDLSKGVYIVSVSLSNGAVVSTKLIVNATN
jgi:hypothetical protein